MYLRELVEDTSTALLYHNTSSKFGETIIHRLELLLSAGVWQGFTSNRIGTHGNPGDTEGTSFTRSKKFALDNKTFGDISFVVDRRKLAANNKIVPHDDFHYAGEGATRTEVEEFVLGDIKNFPDKIVAIHVFMNKENHGSEDTGKSRSQKKIESLLALLVRKHPRIKLYDKSKTSDVRHATDKDGGKSKEIVISRANKLLKRLDALKTAISNLETEHEDDDSALDYIDDRLGSTYDIEQSIRHARYSATEDDADFSELFTTLDAAEKNISDAEKLLPRIVNNLL